MVARPLLQDRPRQLALLPDLDELRAGLLADVYAGEPIPELRAVADRHGLGSWFVQVLSPVSCLPRSRRPRRRR